MHFAEPEFIAAAEIQIGDVLIREDRTLKVLQTESPRGLNGCKIVYRDASAPCGSRPSIFWVLSSHRIARVMASSEIVARQARGLS